MEISALVLHNKPIKRLLFDKAMRKYRYLMTLVSNPGILALLMEDKFQTGFMQISHVDFTSKRENLLILRKQNEILPFTERPSDEHNIGDGEYIYYGDNRRRNPFELFSLFTADIIKKKVIFTK